MHGFVCLFPIQISTAWRCAAKCAMPAEGRMGCVLRGLACNYLPCGRRRCEVFLSRMTETPFLIDMRSPITGTPWNVPRCTAEGSPQAVLLGASVRLYTCPVAAKMAPDILGWWIEMPIYFLFGIMCMDPLGTSGCTKYCKDGRENTWDGWAECCAPVDT